MRDITVIIIDVTASDFVVYLSCSHRIVELLVDVESHNTDTLHTSGQYTLWVKVQTQVEG